MRIILLITLPIKAWWIPAYESLVDRFPRSSWPLSTVSSPALAASHPFPPPSNLSTESLLPHVVLEGYPYIYIYMYNGSPIYSDTRYT